MITSSIQKATTDQSLADHFWPKATIGLDAYSTAGNGNPKRTLAEFDS